MVVLLRDLPHVGLIAGDSGVVVYAYEDPRAFEVEFPNPAGKPRYVVVTVRREHLLKLRNLDLRLRPAG